MNPPPPPQSFPYDHLFKILTIGDAGVGKVRCSVEPVHICVCSFCFDWCGISSRVSDLVRRRTDRSIGRNLSEAGLAGLLLSRVCLFTWDTCVWSHDAISDNLLCRVSRAQNERLTLFSLPKPRRSHQSFFGSPMIPSMITYSPRSASTSR